MDAKTENVFTKKIEELIRLQSWVHYLCSGYIYDCKLVESYFAKK